MRNTTEVDELNEHPPKALSWIEIGQKNIHVYEELTQTYETLLTNDLPNSPNDKIIISALKNIIEHLGNMYDFYQTSPFNPEVKNRFLQQNQTRQAEWSVLLAQWEQGHDDQPVHLKLYQEQEQTIAKPAIDIEDVIVSVPQISEYAHTELKQAVTSEMLEYGDTPIKKVVIQNAKIDKQEDFDHYRLLELSLGLMEQ